MNLNDISNETIRLFTESYKSADKTMSPQVLKDIGVAAGLQIYNLEAPSKLLYPANTPFLNRIPRMVSNGGTSTRWRQITAYAKPTGADTFIAEGAAAGQGTITTSEVLAAYKSQGVRDKITFEAIASGKNFEDVKAKMALVVMNRVKVEEEKSALYANPGTGSIGYALPAPVAPTVTTASTGGSIAAITPTVFVMALTGAAMWDMGCTSAVNIKPTSFSLKHGANSTGTTGSAITGTGTIKASTTAVNGAIGYAWWIGSTATFAAATTKLEAVTTTPDVFLTAALGGTVISTTGGPAGGQVTSTDDSAQANAYTGLAGYIYKNVDQTKVYSAAGGGLQTGTGTNGSNAYLKTFIPDATNFDGTPLTANTTGGITEIDDANVAVFNNAQVSPNLLLVSGSDQQKINKLAGASAATNLSQIIIANGPGGSVTNNSRTGALINGVTGQEQMFLVSPNMIPGTLFGVTETLPYLEANVTSVLEFDNLADYVEIDYAATSTSGPNTEFEVRTYGTFKDYAAFTQFSLQGFGA